MQNHFQRWHKFTNIAWIDITLISLLQYLDTFLSTLCTWRVRSSRPEDFFKKSVLKNFRAFTGKHRFQGLFCDKVAGWRPATSLNTKSGAFLWILRIFKDIYFANVCESLPLKNKIFTRVSFRKILGFYYKWNR